jgi:hypothetical protein
MESWYFSLRYVLELEFKNVQSISVLPLDLFHILNVPSCRNVRVKIPKNVIT